MLLATLSALDYGVLLLYLAAMLGLGVYFSGRQTDAAEFFLGSRSLGWFPLGLSLMATLISALTYTGLPAQAYQHGLKCWLMPASFWLILPLVVWLVIPIYRGLALGSLYEYLEYRFDARVRLLASLIFVVWRLLWLGGVIYAPCKALLIASGWQIDEWMLIVPLGLITTAYTFLGGMRAVVWTDVVQGFVMLFGIAVVIGGVWLSLAGGPLRVAEVAEHLGRTAPVDSSLQWDGAWTLWGALPHWFLANLSFYMADQITAQRFLCAKSVNAARTSYLINTLALTFLLPGLIYVGLCLLAFYHDHPEELRPEWVVNLDGVTREPIRGSDGQPLLAAAGGQQRLDPDTLPELLAEGRLLRPNDKAPFTSPDELLDADGRVRIEMLIMRTPLPGGGAPGEIVLRKGTLEQMLPHFIATQLSWGAAGTILAALLAGAMSSIDSGLNAICSLLVTDLHRRFGWGRTWLARRRGKPVASLTEIDELALARPLTLIIGLAATAFSIAVAQIADIFSIMVSVANTFGAPLLAVFLLGMLTRRTTAAAALLALLLGSAATLGFTAVNKLAAAGVVIPRAYAIAEIWTVIVGVLATLAIGYLASFVLGKRKSPAELRGLVAGCGRLGTRAIDETVPIFS